MPKQHSQLDVQPNNNNDAALQHIKHHYQLPHQPFFMQQVHGTDRVALIEPPKKHFWQSADAIFTQHQDIICTIMTADCLPVLISDTKASFVAAVHCGWRSLYHGILTQVLNDINSMHSLVVWFGPAICQKHYQVDKAFKEYYLQTQPAAEQAFTDIVNNHCYADLKALAMVQLAQYDVARIVDSEICTFADNQYYSWRRNKTTARQASMIWIKTRPEGL